MALTSTVRRAVRRAAREISDRPPANARLATYADVLDGRHLTVVLEHPGAGFALRLDGRPVTLPAADADPDEAVQLDLGALTGLPAEWQAELLLDGDPVWVPPSVGGSPVLPPPAPGGDRRFRVARGRRGVLLVEQLPVVRCVDALGFALVDAGIEVRLPAGTTGEVLLLGGGEVRRTLPVIAETDHSRCVITLDDVPTGGAAQELELELATDRTPLGRHRNDLDRPGAGVVLPTLYDADQPRLRLRFRRDGTLVADLPG